MDSVGPSGEAPQAGERARGASPGRAGQAVGRPIAR